MRLAHRPVLVTMPVSFLVTYRVESERRVCATSWMDLGDGSVDAGSRDKKQGQCNQDRVNNAHGAKWKRRRTKMLCEQEAANALIANPLHWDTAREQSSSTGQEECIHRFRRLSNSRWWLSGAPEITHMAG
ncbi:hypothetical protein B0T14DRAFT_7331 [Immersiella caudata]|uniref:Uncharacterized protein n=1 Tax=Immersiella caudata TaxID=314043 RepID=A0AA39XDG4_9PEZI|nr:hypothetical protein B0T14DRAFT_7331 [Immersiella caudata]